MSKSDKVVKITEEAFNELEKFRETDSNLREVISEIIIDYMNLMNSLEFEKREAYRKGYGKGYSKGFNEGWKEREEKKRRIGKAFSKPGDRY